MAGRDENPPTGNLDRFIESNVPVAGPGRMVFLRARESLRQKGMRTLSDLLQGIQILTHEEQFIALCALAQEGEVAERISGRSHNYWVKWIVSCLRSDDSMLSSGAVTALSRIANEQDIKELLKIINNSIDMRLKILCIQVLLVCENIKSPLLTESVTEVLRAVLADATACSDCRATAAEAIGKVAQSMDRRRSSYRSSVEALLSALESESPAIRYFCIFALGELREKRALSPLRKISRTDIDVCPGMPEGQGGIREEASRALRKVLGRGGQRPGREY